MVLLLNYSKRATIITANATSVPPTVMRFIQGSASGVGLGNSCKLCTRDLNLFKHGLDFKKNLFSKKHL